MGFNVGKHEKLLRKLSAGKFTNVSFGEFKSFLLSYGFDLARISGSHHIFTHPGMREIVNIQNVKGEAKPYQIRQALQLIEKYNLQVKDE